MDRGSTQSTNGPAPSNSVLDPPKSHSQILQVQCIISPNRKTNPPKIQNKEYRTRLKIQQRVPRGAVDCSSPLRHSLAGAWQQLEMVEIEPFTGV